MSALEKAQMVYEAQMVCCSCRQEHASLFVPAAPAHALIVLTDSSTLCLVPPQKYHTSKPIYAIS